MFKKYQHLERWGTTEVEGIEKGTCFVFPKLDGTNASVWLENGEIKAASRKKELSLENDNHGFYKFIIEQENIKEYLLKHPNHRLFGEFLVPHTVKTYEDSAWRKFYVFDVVEDLEEELLSGEKFRYIPYCKYIDELNRFNIDYIEMLDGFKNITIEDINKKLNENTYLIEEGKGTGEGVVIKNYSFINKYGRTTWAKIVSSEFKQTKKDSKKKNPEEKRPTEEAIVEKYITKSLVEKEFAKIESESGWNSKMIARLLSTIYYCLIKEESWNFIKEHKNPLINFRYLNSRTCKKIKELKPELF